MLDHDDAAAAKFSDAGRRIVSGGLDKTMRWRDAATGRPIGEPLSVDDPDVRVLLPLDEDRLMSFGWLNTVRLWDALTLRPIGEPLRLGPYDPMRPITPTRKRTRSRPGPTPASCSCGTPQPCGRSVNP